MNAQSLSNTPSLSSSGNGSTQVVDFAVQQQPSRKRRHEHFQTEHGGSSSASRSNKGAHSADALRAGTFERTYTTPLASLLPSPSRSPRQDSLDDYPFDAPLPPRQYRGDESIILLGFFGVGKRTLGLIASAALRKDFIDFDVAFKGQTGLSPRKYVESQGFTAYRNVEDEITSEVCRTKQKGCVLVGFFAMPSSRQRQLLRSLSATNPLIHVQRAASDVLTQSHSNEDHLDRTYKLSDKLHRKFANFEFFNITQPATDAKLPGPLKLKPTEREFLRFLHKILPHSKTLLYAPDLLSRTYTYALQVPTAWLKNPRADFTELDCGADAVLLSVDVTVEDQQDIYYQLSQRVALLRKHCHVPIILDLKAPAIISSASYVTLLELMLRQAPDFIVISLESDRALASQLTLAQGQSMIIGKTHRSLPVSDNWGSKEWQKIYENAKALGCSAVRVTGEAHYSHDNLESVRVILEARRMGVLPTSCYNYGQYGRSSVCLNPVLSPVVLPSKSSDGVTLVEAQRALYSSFLLPKRHFTLFGRTVSYSLTPAMHNAAYKACGLPHTFDFVESDHVTKIHEILKREDQGGFAVSLPFKTELVSMMDEMSDDARIIGAVNTVVVDRVTTPNGPLRLYLKGFNTDHIGFRSCIEQNLSPANAIRPQSSALIIGAGGMARAAIYACVQAGVKNICIFNRTEANARRLADYFSTVYPKLFLSVLSTLETPWPAHISYPTIIVSCIPTHKFGENAAPDLLIPEQWLRSPTGGVFVEFAYKPLVTKLVSYMRQRRSQGWIVVDGLDVLVEEGIAQFEVLTKRTAPSHIMRRTVREQYPIVVEPSI